MRLHAILPLVTADIYSAPQNPADLLPVVYGDFVSPGVHAPNEDSGGCTPCVCINRNDGVLLASFSRCVTPVTADDQPQLYFNDVLQQPTTSDGTPLYTYYPAVDYEAKGFLIAGFQLAPEIKAAATAGQWSCRIKGTVDANNQLITNPIWAIKDFFLNHGLGWVEQSFDPGSMNRAAMDCDARAFTMHWSFQDNLTYKEHLARVLQHCLATHGIDANGRLRIAIDADPIWPELVTALLDAREHLAGEDPESSVELDIDERNLCNRVLLNYRYKWHTGDYTTLGARLESLQSQQKYGSIREKPFDLPGIRTDAHALAWATQVLRRSADLPTTVRLRIPQLQFAFLFPGSYFGLTYRYGPERHGRGWTNRILLVRNLGADPMPPQQEVSLECIDTGVSYHPTTYIRMRDPNNRLWYVYVDESGTLTAEEADPGIELMNPEGDWTWLSRVNPLSTTYYLYPIANTAGTGVEFAIDTAQPAGDGSSLATLTFVNRLYQGWVIGVDERPMIMTRRVG